MKKRPTMLSATFVKSVNVPGRYGDGRGGLGLTLLVKPSSRRGCRKSWGQSIRINGRKTTLGLGTYPVITLAMARERALENARAIAAVPHGFRSSFRDWAAECTEAPREVCELALAHVNNDRVEAAYRRSDLFERRRILMQQWADYLDSGR